LIFCRLCPLFEIWASAQPLPDYFSTPIIAPEVDNTILQRFLTSHMQLFDKIIPNILLGNIRADAALHLKDGNWWIANDKITVGYLSWIFLNCCSSGPRNVKGLACLVKRRDYF